MGLRTSLKHAWNAFTEQDRDPFANTPSTYGGTMFMRPDRPRIRVANERSLISSIYTRMSVDAAGIDMKHVQLDEEGRYIADVVSGLNECLTIEANIDQSARQLRLDAVHTMLDSGVAAIVPIETTINPVDSGSWDVKNMRVGEVVQWYPKHVTVNVYNELRGEREDITLPKSMVAIATNPFYEIMNKPNSTLQRLIHKLNLLDVVDEATSSGKLDMLIQLPYVVKSEMRRKQAEEKIKSIEMQLNTGKNGIAYIDGTEKVIPLNRSLENKLLTQIEFLWDLLYSQLGLTKEIMNGSASEDVMQNYYSRTIEPLLDAVKEAMVRTFLTKTARTQGKSIMYFRNPFKLIPISKLADISDVFARNEIATSNEIRGGIGMKPSKETKADKLQNSNMPDYELKYGQGKRPPQVTAEQIQEGIVPPGPMTRRALPVGSKAKESTA